MKKTHHYLLAIVLLLTGLLIMGYKWHVLKFPLQPSEEVSVWTVQARISLKGRGVANTVALRIPKAPLGYTIIDEKFVAQGYSEPLLGERAHDREAQWSTRRARGEKALYYRATITEDINDGRVFDAKPSPNDALKLEEPYLSAAKALLADVRETSASSLTYAQELLRRMNAEAPSQEVALLQDLHQNQEEKIRIYLGLLAMRNIPTQRVHVISLKDTVVDATLEPWVFVHTGTQWVALNPENAMEGLPSQYMIWHVGMAPVMSVDHARDEHIQFSVSRNLVDAMAIAEKRLEVKNTSWVKYSLLSLPLQTQGVYRILLMVPLGAFLMLVMRNLIGIKTFGTFMPVLIALAFRETQLLAGVVLFVLVVACGLLVRFYLERLKLLLVPRLTAVLIIVVLLMCMVSVFSAVMGIEVGLSVALFPMVIMAMTIERMSISWDERGAGVALTEGFGTLLVACLAYLVMSWSRLEYLVFVYPESLLILLAFTLLIGRYSGYRLSELLRFRALAESMDDSAQTLAHLSAKPSVLAAKDPDEPSAS